ncbi:hypothetical protein HBI64_211610 [Parastagonospora nodorum]|nr:hypothetical protein HBI64_211610 [Parastagonospora nodorum]
MLNILHLIKVIRQILLLYLVYICSLRKYLCCTILEKTFAILSYSKVLATKHRASSKSLLFLALAYLKNLGVLVILSSEELLALVILRLLEAPSNSAA